MRRTSSGRSHSRRVLRPRSYLLATLALISMVGCQPQYRDRDRWPVCALPPTASRPDVAWLSPADSTTIYVSRTDTGPCLGESPWVAAICVDPVGSGFVVFRDHWTSHITRSDDVWSTMSTASPAERVRAATRTDSGTLVVITGGQAQPLPRQTDAADEPIPWLMGGEARIATLTDGQLSVGDVDVQTDWNPWRLKSGRFAGEESILVFVYKRSPFDAVARSRPFIYRVATGDDGLPHLQARWRGTSFSHPFVDATFGDFTGSGEGEIAALEVGRDGGRLLTAYHFQGFGLEGLAPGIDLPGVEDCLAAADVTGDAREELIVHRPTSAGETGPQFIAYGLTDAPEPTLAQVGSCEAPDDVLAWEPIARRGTSAGAVVCVTVNGTELRKIFF